MQDSGSSRKPASARNSAVRPPCVAIAQRAVAGAHPGVQHLLEGLAGTGGAVAGVLPDGDTRPRERQHNHADANAVHRLLRQLASEKEHASRTEGGKQRNQPDVVKKEHVSQLRLKLSAISCQPSVKSLFAIRYSLFALRSCQKTTTACHPERRRAVFARRSRRTPIVAKNSGPA